MKVVFVGSNHNIQQMVDICQLHSLEVFGIVDGDYWNNTTHIDAVPVVGSESQWDWSSNYYYFVATNWTLGTDPVHQRNRQKRINHINLLQQNHIQCINLIHPTAVVPITCTLGNGIMIGANAVLGNHCRIGNHCQIREQSYLAHSATLGNNVILQVQSYIGSHVTVQDHSYVGIKSSIIARSAETLTIPDNSFIKSHSLITSVSG